MQRCSNTIKIWGKVFEARLRRQVMIHEQQYGSVQKFFALSVSMEKYREGQKDNL